MGGGHSTSLHNKNLIDDTNFKNAIRKSTKVLNKITTTLVQEQLTNISANSTVYQKMNFNHLRAKKDIVLKGLHMEQTVQINVSVLADSKAKSSLVSDLTQSIQDSIKKLSTSTQNELEKKGEQIFSSALDDLSNAFSSTAADVTGSTNLTSANTTLQQLLNIDNETDLDNEITEAVSSKMVTKTVNNIASTFLAKQEINVKDVKTTQGQIIITDISEELLNDNLIKTVSKSGLSDSVISKLSGIQTSQIESINKSTQESASTSTGTITDVGDSGSKLIDSAGDAVAKTSFMLMLPFILMGFGFLIFLGIMLYAFRGVIASFFGGGGSSSENTSEKEQEEEDEGPVEQTGKGFKENMGFFNVSDSNELFNVIIIIFIVILVFLLFKDLTQLAIRFKHT